MSYIIEQKIKNKIYLYKVESYWDKEKKQARQKRVYIGPKDKKPIAAISKSISNLTSHNFGNIYFLKEQIAQIKLDELLKQIYPDNYNEILALAMYELSEGSPSYLFSYWLNEQYLPGVKKLSSSGISALYEELGRNQTSRDKFFTKWIKQNASLEGIYYDITSISSYSTKIDYIEWGYNRDKENLPQLNMGIMCDIANGLPIYYNVHYGSIVDVTTLKNGLKHLLAYTLKNILIILDKGFFSTSNIVDMSSKEYNFKFIQPISLSLKKAKELIARNRKKLRDISSTFVYNKEVLHHVEDEILFQDILCRGHIFYNEKSELEQRHKFVSELIEFEKNIPLMKDKREFEMFTKNYISEKYQKYFKWNNKLKQVERDVKKINQHIANFGCFLIATREEIDKTKILEYYRKRDAIEKIFDIMKNEMDGDRLRVRSNYNVDGKLFVKFIALIIYMKVTNQMKSAKLFEKISLKEMLLELKKIKIIQVNDFKKFYSEISKQNKNLLKALKVNLPDA